MKGIKHRQGFTLIEMLIVIAIIAILAMLAMPSMTPGATRKQVEESLEKIERYKPMIQNNHQLRAALPGITENQLFPIHNDDIAGMPKADEIIGNFIDNVAVKDGVITLRFSANANKVLQGKLLSVQPTYVKDSYNQDLDWSCGYKKIPDGKTAAGKNETNIERKYLPAICR